MKNDRTLMNDYISLLKHDAIKMFPGATSVSIFINAYEVTVNPTYNGQLDLDRESMKTIDGKWCSKQK